MKSFLQVFTYTIITLTVIICQKDSDEGRPYEFGFTIDGQQHRHEKKDQNGIIQGEFGFITADGIYHVTVYATDENGNFKILSMKNIRISAPLDGSPATGPISPEAGKYLKKQNRNEQPEKPLAPVSQQFEKLPSSGPQSNNVITTRKPRVTYDFTTQPTIKPACGGCGYVTTTAKPVSKQPDINYPSVSKFPQFENRFQSSVSDQNRPPSDIKISSQSFHGDNPTHNNFQQLQNQQGGTSGLPVAGFQGGTDISQNYQSSQQNSDTQQQHQFGHLTSGKPGLSLTNFQPNLQVNQAHQQYQDSQQYSQDSEGYVSNQNGLIRDQNNKRPFQGDTEILANIPGIGSITTTGQLAPLSAPSTGSNKPNSLSSISQLPKLPPVSVSDNIIHVGGKHPMDIPIKDKFPGMVDGLPDGVEETDVKNILYKFKYTVGFHGHYEKGLKNGTKIGGYFVNGRDGVSRVVTYIADENGYRPKFKFINLGLDSPDTPKEDTEKTFGLKSFEFVWYPIE
nr:uncharacterized protein LOC111510838 [Leptinotarsa decemlineata]